MFIFENRDEPLVVWGRHPQIVSECLIRNVENFPSLVLNRVKFFILKIELLHFQQKQVTVIKLEEQWKAK